MVIFNISFFSPRWGRNDTYTFQIEQQEILITAENGMKAKCVENENGFKWTGDKAYLGNPLVKIMENDYIENASNFLENLMYFWTKWKNNEISNEDFENELNKPF